MWALVENGIVTQPFPSPMPFTAGGVQYPAQWFDSTTTEEKAAIGVLPMVQDAIPEGYHPIGTTYEVTDNQVIQHWELEADPLPAKEQLKGYTENKERIVEESGIMFDGAVIPTNRDAQGIISRAAFYYESKVSPAEIYIPKQGGGFKKMDPVGLTAMAAAVEEHVLLSLNAAGTIYEGIDAGSITTYEQIDAHPAWPPVPPAPSDAPVQ